MTPDLIDLGVVQRLGLAVLTAFNLTVLAQSLLLCVSFWFFKRALCDTRNLHVDPVLIWFAVLALAEAGSLAASLLHRIL